MRYSTLTVLPLEDRSVPAQFGLGWANPQNISISFVQDGTGVNGQASNLVSTLQQQGFSELEFKSEILRAAQQWADVASIDFQITEESSNALFLGTSGSIQGDSRFGDIRIAGRALGEDVVAITTSPDSTLGTLAGDIIVNTTKLFRTSGEVPTYDLYTVFLQEFGHAFGVDAINDSTSVMKQGYNGTKTGLSSLDVQAIQQIYGSPTAGTTTAVSTGTNITLATAETLQFLPNSYRTEIQGQFPSNGSAFFRLENPGTNTTHQTAILRLQYNPAAGTPQLHALDAAGNLISLRILQNSNGILLAQVDQLAAGQSISIAVTGSANEQFQLDTQLIANGFSWNASTSGTLSPTDFVDTQAFQLQQTGILTFAMQVNAASTGAIVQYRLLHATGNLVATFDIAAGSTRTITMLLNRGNYYWEYNLLEAGSASIPVHYGLLIRIGSDPTGVEPINPDLPPPPPQNDQPPSPPNGNGNGGPQPSPPPGEIIEDPESEGDFSGGNSFTEEDPLLL